MLPGTGSCAGQQKQEVSIDIEVSIDPRATLPSLLPAAIKWAEARSREAAASGRSLNEREIAVARAVGVQQPELIRVAVVDSLPLPEDTTLRAAALQTGLLGPDMAGLTFGYSVLVCRGHETVSLLSHEFRHVHQYESFGSVAAFLPEYLKQIVEFGYADAPFEIDAKAHEQADT
jgi:hypothetical protein